MTQRNRIAWAYLIAVPVVLAIVLVQNGALFRAISLQGDLLRAVSALDECDTISALLEQLETTTERYNATGSAGYDELYRAGVSQLHTALQRLQELSKNEVTGLQVRTLLELVKSQTDAWQQGIDSRMRGGVSVHAGAQPPNQLWSTDISKTLADIKRGQQARVQGEKDAAMQSLRATDNLIKYGGVFVLWIVMVAAFLLFHDEKARDWVGIERRAHTRILRALPLSVCLSSESGVIFYVNQVAEDVFGYRPGELMARDVIAPGNSKGEGSGGMLRHIFDRLAPGEVWAGQLPIRRKDGAIVKTASWIKDLEVGEKRCQLLIHCHIEEGALAPANQVEPAHV